MEVPVIHRRARGRHAAPVRHAVPAFLALLAGCVEYTPTTSRPPEDPPAPPVVTGPVPDCALEAPVARAVPVGECIGLTRVPDPWRAVVEWRWAVPAGDEGVATIPIAAPLDDDDGDGRITDLDEPDVLVQTIGTAGDVSGRLAVLDARGAERFVLDGWDVQSHPAIADVDGDGAPEIVALGEDFYAHALHPDGSELWRSAALAPNWDRSAVTVVDLTSDGSAEVIVDGSVLDGASGALLAVLPRKEGFQDDTTLVADLDQDGSREIVFEGDVFSASGQLLWTTAEDVLLTAFPMAVELDGDPGGELVVSRVTGVPDAWAPSVGAWDSDGTLLWTTSFPRGTSITSPCAADLDGDGGVDIAVVVAATLYRLDASGGIVWSAPVPTGYYWFGAAPSAFDFDGDGAAEVAFASDTELVLYDGRTGAVLLHLPLAFSANGIYDVPVVADVDGDGAAEILVPTWSDGPVTGGGVTVYGHDGPGWAPAPRTWRQLDHAVTNLGPDGAVPAGEIPPWQRDDLFHAQPVVEGPTSDPILRVAEACTACESDAYEVAWQVENAGPEDLIGATVELVALTPDGELLLASQPLDPVRSGTAPAGGVLRVAADAGGGAAMVLRLRDASDCVTGDTEVALAGPGCP